MSNDATEGLGKRTKWTVMVFMGAATLDGESSLVTAADDDIKEMMTVGSDDDLHIFVQRYDQSDVVSRFKVLPGRLEPMPIPEDERRLDSGHALATFIEASLGAAEHQPGDNSLLVLWGHAYDFAFGRTRTRNGAIDAIDFAELSGTLRELQHRYAQRLIDTWRPQPGGALPTLDVIGFDACDVATVEMATELAPYAKLLLASQVAVPIPGWPYHRILDRLRNPQGERGQDALEFGAYAVRRYCETYSDAMPVSLSCLNLSRSGDLAAAASGLANALVSLLLRSDARDLVLDLFAQAQTATDRPYIDVGDLCAGLIRECQDDAVVSAATTLGDLLTSHVPPVEKNRDAQQRPIVIEHGRNAGALMRLNGLSLYAPHLGTDDPEETKDIYNRFQFVRTAVWSELVHSL